ncbi:MAG: hypothetical protein AAFO61_03705 [Pseudomonadota bacterium]
MAETKEGRKPDLFTLEQLNALGYGVEGEQAIAHHRPLLICDVDEVVMDLVDPFVMVLEERGFELKSHSFKLTGNVFDRETGREATQEEVWAGLTQLFEEQEQRQGLVEGVADGLAHIAESCDILFLTNMPHAYGDTRRAYLAANGIPYPLVTNSRSKAPAISIIADHCRAGAGFVDDTPKNLDHVREAVPAVQLFHFMANDDFRKLAGEIEGVAFSSGDWGHAGPEIARILVENKGKTS